MIITCREAVGELSHLSREKISSRNCSIEYEWRYTIDIYDTARKITYHIEDVSDEEITVLNNSFKYEE